MSVKERIKIFIEYSNMTISAFEKSINVTNGYVNSISKSIGIDKINTILENYPNLSLEWLFTGHGSMTKPLNDVENWINEERIKRREESYEDDTAHIGNSVLFEPESRIYKMKTDKIQERQLIPLYDMQASASVVALFRDSIKEKPIDHISIPGLPKSDGAVYVNGDSMYPLLKSGDIIIYKNLAASIDNIFWGEMYLISLTNDNGDEFVMIKWVQKSDQGEMYIKLVSENRHHQPKDWHLKNVIGLALIKGSVRINSMY
ncbi:S24 family peptidase [Flavobacterium sp.]|uniref:S24 family peptidase n=1 Tax=Flavobacterium sp. TaxID=239 RepID=UPI003267DCB8